jgi:hypothetical protein
LFAQALRIFWQHGAPKQVRSAQLGLRWSGVSVVVEIAENLSPNCNNVRGFLREANTRTFQERPLDLEDGSILAAWSRMPLATLAIEWK